MCMPGDNVDMHVELITPVAMEEGLRFAIREGGHTVGSGVFQDREVISCSEKQYKGRCPQGQRPFLVRPYVIKHIAPRLCTLHKRRNYFAGKVK